MSDGFFRALFEMVVFVALMVALIVAIGAPLGRVARWWFTLWGLG